MKKTVCAVLGMALIGGAVLPDALRLAAML